MSRFFIDRPIVAIVIAIVTILVGAVAVVGLPVAQFPQMFPPQIFVGATYPGADAITMEQSVATPIEQQMNGVDNMLYMQSINANENPLQEFVPFDVNTNVKQDQVNTQNRLGQAQPFLPNAVNQFGFNIRRSTGLPLLLIPLYSPNNTYD